MIRNAGPWSAIHDVKCVAKEYTRTANAKELFSFTQLLQVSSYLEKQQFGLMLS